MEKIHYELVRFDPKGLGKTEPRAERLYRVARFTYFPSGNYLVECPQPDVVFTYAERVNLHHREKDFRRQQRTMPPPRLVSFSAEQISRLVTLRAQVQRGVTEFLVDRYSFETVFDELN